MRKILLLEPQTNINTQDLIFTTKKNTGFFTKKMLASIEP